MKHLQLHPASVGLRLCLELGSVHRNTFSHSLPVKKRKTVIKDSENIARRVVYSSSKMSSCIGSESFTSFSLSHESHISYEYYIRRMLGVCF